ncbi:alpha-N-acetylglucosaminidase [Copidosoma floridanum]|uniref:alpha-N-acetylglucosaminidase n=1 Tax=Copidosoma floridanum TaxID=29053 RepID=UPI0006C968C7|nr:alpha-N-acetylglucosaminidase [Copidosoma floridanum]
MPHRRFAAVVVALLLCLLAHQLLVDVVADHSDGFEGTLGHLGPRTSAQVQTIAARDLAVRVLGEKNADLFQLLVDQGIKPAGKDAFRLKKIGDNKVLVTGSSGVAAAWGLHYYLTRYCDCHVSWEGAQLRLPKSLPDVDEMVASNDRFRYYQNVCTAGYSSTWWQWPQWEKNIDWMALNGINLALAFHAQEAVWQRVYLKMNLSRAEIDQHFGGPAFLPWARMGNIRGWGGPLTSSWHEFTVKLQHSILKRMRELGMIPVLPAFAGHVPRDFIRVFPNASVKLVQPWNNFEDAYCCPYALEPTDPLFQVVGEEFLKTYIGEFGTDNMYNCDSFNENNPHSGDSDYLRNTGKAIFSAMSRADPDAIWLMQGWLFVHSDHFWSNERVKAFVTSVPIGKMIVLDLQSEQFPRYKKFESYYGQPFIWCMLHNFGGTLGMFGSSGIINERVFEARLMNGSTMIGTGLTPEGINQNYVIYELMNEMALAKRPVKLDDWFANYAIRRYGVADDSTRIAWQELGSTVYNYNDTRNIRGHYVITRRPSLKIEPWYWYDLKDFLRIWRNFVTVSNETASSELFKHDIVDLSRQALQITADFIYEDIRQAYKLQNVTLLQSASKQLLSLYEDLEEILASSPDFLLGRWLESAKSVASSDVERANFEFNARNQITLWGPKGEIVDYANKQWSGVVKDYFGPRWARYLVELCRSLMNHEALDSTRVRQIIFNEIELPFSYANKSYPTEPTGDSIKIAMRIYNKWSSLWK